MTDSRQIRAILRPSVYVVLAFAAWLSAHSLWSVWGEPTVEDQLPALAGKHVLLPDPRLSPVEVVEIQLRGLSQPGKDGVGILQCFCFASPRNRSATGPLDRFGQMVREEPFACLGDSRAALIGTPQIDDRFARLVVTIVDQQEQLRAFTFILFKQQGEPFADCWMTEAVYPQGGLAPSPQAEPDAQSDAA